MKGFGIYNSFFKDVIYLSLDRGEGREKEREKNMNVWLLLMHPHTRECKRGCIGLEQQDTLVGTKYTILSSVLMLLTATHCSSHSSRKYVCPFLK